MSYASNSSLTASASAPAGADWVTVAEINARAKHEAEVAIRTYVQSPKQSREKEYDDRLHVRLNCGKTKAYGLLKAYEQGHEGGLRHRRIGNKYIVTEQAIKEWEGGLEVSMHISHRKAA